MGAGSQTIRYVAAQTCTRNRSSHFQALYLAAQGLIYRRTLIIKRPLTLLTLPLEASPTEPSSYRPYMSYPLHPTFREVIITARGKLQAPTRLRGRAL